MKVLLVNSVCGVGSTGRICTDLYDELVKHDIECCIAYGRGQADCKYNTYKIGSKLNNIIHGFESRAFDNHGFSSRVATKKFIDFIDLYNPDIIHLHNLHGYYLNIEIFFSFLKKIENSTKIIWTLHDMWPFSGHQAYLETDSDDNLRATNYAIVNKREYPKSYIYTPKYNLQRKKKIFTSLSNIIVVTPSSWLKRVTEKTFFNKYNVIHIFNGIDLKNFYPDTKKKLKKRNILAVANIWDDRKGLPDILWLSNNLNKEKYLITVIGDTKNRKLPKGIKHISKTDSISTLRKYYSNADLFINPTYQDNLPTTNIEALACGTPVITYDTGGSGEVLDKKSGVVLNKGDRESLLNTVENAIFYDEKDCIDKSKEFDKSIMTKKYLKVYLS